MTKMVIIDQALVVIILVGMSLACWGLGGFFTRKRIAKAFGATHLVIVDQIFGPRAIELHYKNKNGYSRNVRLQNNPVENISYISKILQDTK